MSSLPGLTFALVSASDIPAAFALEIAGFPADEAATLESLQTRQSLAPTLFLGAYLPSTDSPTPKLIGFTCSTLTPSSTLTHDSMSTHVAGAPYVAIHSVCISGEYRRKGVAVALLKEYLARVEKDGVKGARLITHEELVPLYAKAGFAMVGESEVVHGERKWWEMKVDFGEREKVVVVEEVRNPGSTWESFGGIEALLDDEGRNKADLFCPRGECRCILLKATVGKYVRRPASDLTLPELPHPISSTTPALPSAGYWSIPSPLAFENIGFSRNALPPSSSTITTAPGATIKYLICADCDHGPLGWHDTEGRDLGLEVEEENEGKGEVRKGREFLLDVGRLRYRVKE